MTGFITDWLNEQANKPLTLPVQTRVFHATFKNRDDAELAAQLLSLTAIAARIEESPTRTRVRIAAGVTRQPASSETTVRALYHYAPDQAQEPKRQARLIRQTLSDAGLDPIEATFTPPPPLDEGRTWHRYAAQRAMPSKADRKALRTKTSLILEQKGPHDLPPEVGGSLNGDETDDGNAGDESRSYLKLTDESELTQIPASVLIFITACALVLVVTMIELSGTDRWFTGLTSAALLLPCVQGFLLAKRASSRKRVGVGFAVAAGILLAYALGVWQARSAPSEVTWGAFSIGLVILAAYLGVARAVIAWRRSNPTLTRRLGAAFAAFGAAVLTSGAAPAMLRTQFQHGLGAATTPLDIPTFELLWALQDPLKPAIATLILMCAGVGMILHGGGSLAPAMVRHFLVGMLLITTLTTFLVIGGSAYEIGAEIRHGNLNNAQGLATCGYVEGAPSAVNTARPLIVVGPASGPSVLIDSTGTARLVSEGLTVRLVPLKQCASIQRPQRQ